MKKDVIMKLQDILNQQRQEILETGKTIRIDYTTAEEELRDEVDLAVNDAAQGMRMRLGNRASLYFKKVEEALLRIQDGSYGACTNCGGEISLRRLEVRPTAELCIECKEVQEKKERLHADGRTPKSLGTVLNFKA